MDHFVTQGQGLLNDRNHGVLLTSVTLITEMCEVDPACLEAFRPVRDNRCAIVSSLSDDFADRTTPRSTFKITRCDWL